MSVLEIGSLIKERRKMLGITQPNLAEMAEISINTLYKIETGKANPTLNVTLKIAQILGLELKLTVRQPEL